MVDEDILKEIETGIQSGFSKSQIKQGLLTKGYSDYDVSEAFRLKNKPKKSISSFSVIKTQGSEKKVNKIILIAIGVLVGAIIAFGLLTFLSLKHPKPVQTFYSISEDALISGIYLNLTKKSILEIDIGLEKYNLTVNSIDSEKIFLDEFEIFLKNRSFIDLNSDGNGDLFIFLENVEKRVALVYLQKIENLTCIENWNCSEWGPCVNNFKTRICVDLNLCGTNNLKPILEIACEDSTQQNDQEIDSISCGEDFDCFVDYSLDCTPATVVNIVELNFYGIISTSISGLEIKGKDIDGKCLFYDETQDFFIEYSDQYVQELLNQGFNQGEIDEFEIEDQILADQFIGLWYECALEEIDLIAMLELWKQEDYSIIVECSPLDELGEEWNCFYQNLYSSVSCESGKL